MLNILTETTAAETGNNIAGIATALILGAGLLVGIGKLVQALAANTKANDNQTKAIGKIVETQGTHTTHIAVLRADVDNLKESDRDQWAKINRVAESGIHQAIRK